MFSNITRICFNLSYNSEIFPTILGFQKLILTIDQAIANLNYTLLPNFYNKLLVT